MTADEQAREALKVLSADLQRARESYDKALEGISNAASADYQLQEINMLDLRIPLDVLGCLSGALQGITLEPCAISPYDPVELRRLGAAARPPTKTAKVQLAHAIITQYLTLYLVFARHRDGQERVRQWLLNRTAMKLVDALASRVDPRFARLVGVRPKLHEIFARFQPTVGTPSKKARAEKAPTSLTAVGILPLLNDLAGGTPLGEFLDGKHVSDLKRAPAKTKKSQRKIPARKRAVTKQSASKP